MRRSSTTWWIAVVVLVVSLTTYFAAYLILPRRIRDGGVRYYRIRQFDLVWQVYLFAPAGFAESLAVRAGRAFRRQEQCGESVVLRARDSKLQFLAAADPPTLDAPLPDEVDILEFAAKHPPYGFGHSSRGNIPCKYNNCDVDIAAEALRELYPRPYTVTKVLRWYEEACDEQIRVHLLHVLAASRDPRAALVLASALRSSFRLRLAAVSAFNMEFGCSQCSGGGGIGTEFENADDWLEENYVRLLREASHLSIN